MDEGRDRGKMTWSIYGFSLCNISNTKEASGYKDNKLIRVFTPVAITYHDKQVRGLGPHFHLFVFLAATASLFRTHKHVDSIKSSRKIIGH